MEAKIGKYGIWVSNNEMDIILKALSWYENSCYSFDKTSNVGLIKNLRKDFDKIQQDGVQVPKSLDNSKLDDEQYNDLIKCKECD